MAASGPMLIDVLGVREGIVCTVGAGGKKSLLYQLVSEHPGRVAMTATSHTTDFPPDLDVEQIVDDEAMLRRRIAAVAASRSVAYACPSSKSGRLAGVSEETIRTIHEESGFAATFVKADGARMRWIKAPGDHEPMVMTGADAVVPVVSARAIGEPLTDRVAHRAAQLASVTGVAEGMPLTPEAVGRLLASDEGALRRAGDARIVPVINMVDDAQTERLARAAASAALAMTTRFDFVVLCCLRRPAAPVVGVVGR